MTDDITGFRRRLNRHRRRYQAGLLLREVMRVAGYALILLVALAVADFFMALPPRVLLAVDLALIFLLVVAMLDRARRCLRFTLCDAARQADQAVGSARRDVLSALELTHDTLPAQATEFYQFLVARIVQRAAAQVRSLGVRQRWPAPELGKQRRILLAQILVAVLVLGVPASISSVVLSRILFPARDIPPYSRYQFTVRPALPRVLYGGTIELAAEIDGAPVKSTVWLMTRQGRQVQGAPCFQENPRRFTQRIEKVTQSLEFCFATGHARSRWQSVELLLDPQVVAARLRLVPPAYSGLKPREFLAGDQKLEGLKGTRVELELTSNRPLSRGGLTLRAKRAGAEVASIDGSKTGLHGLLFRWSLDQPAELEAAIVDVRGTRNQRRFALEQFVMPDEPPRAALTEPAGFSLATPRAHLPLAGYAEDDLGLTRVEFVRAVVGYRDRTQPIGPDGVQRHLTFTNELDLGRLGVEPGQELELYLEAFDSNPAMSGVSASEIARVEIIADEDYAEMLRAKVRTQEFLDRYRAAQSVVAELKRKLKEFQDALAAGGLSEEQRKQRWAEARELNDKAARLFRQMAGDFPAYDAETSMNELLGQMASTLEEHAQWMASPPAFAEGYGRTVSNMLDRLGGYDQPMQAQLQKAEEIARIARLMELSIRYRELVAAQERLVRRLERESDAARMRDSALFRLMHRNETEIHNALIEFRDALRERAGDLTEDYAELKDSALQFAAKVDELEIPDLTAQAAAAAQNEDGAKLNRQASLALERMRSLLSSCKGGGGGFGGLVNCELRFKVPAECRPTLQQMLGGWKMGRGIGKGRGTGLAGMGLEGSGDDGYAMDGYSPLNVPTYGPQRTGLSGMTPSGEGGTQGVGSGRPAAGIAENAREAMGGTMPVDMERKAVLPEKVPEKYRDALKKYFGGGKRD